MQNTKNIGKAIDHMTLRERIEFIGHAMDVRRYHQRYTTQPDTVGHHSARVLALAAIIDPDCTKEVLLACLSHDFPEWITGDLPSPMKRALTPEARRIINDIEGNVLTALGYPVHLTLEDSQLLKLCDCIEGTLFCIEEIRRGNREMREVADTYISYILPIIASTKNMRWWSRANEAVMYLTHKLERVNEGE